LKTHLESYVAPIGVTTLTICRWGSRPQAQIMQMLRNVAIWRT